VKYSLLTKTECKSDYLLTDEELRDRNNLPFWIKPNPHKQSYSNMLLYCRSQVEEYGFKKWGGEKGLDLEIERRQKESVVRKKKKFKKQTVELRRKTMTSVLKTREDHQHEFESLDGMMTCKTCSLEIEYEEF
jgi:DNA-repair protein complementing XP-A cells